MEKVWTLAGNANWSLPTAWLDGIPPTAPGDPGLDVRFRLPVTATNDLGPFTLGRLVLESSGPGILTIANSTGSSLLFGGERVIEQRGTGDAVITGSVSALAGTDGLMIRGSGAGNLTLGVMGTAAQTVTIDAAAPTVATQIIALSSTPAGGVILKAGNLALGAADALGTGTLTVRGGTLRMNSVYTVPNNFSLESDLLIPSANGSTLSGVISSATPGTGLTLRNGNSTLNLTGVNTYTGPTTLDYPLSFPSTQGSGAIVRLSGNGSVRQSSLMDVRAGTTLQIDMFAGATDRIGNSAPVHLTSGSLLLTGAAGGTAQEETIGALQGTGFSTVTLTPSTITGSGSVKLSPSALERVDRGTFLFRGTSLGGNNAIGVSNVRFSATPVGLFGGGAASGPNMSILPYAIGDTTSTGAGATLVSYDTTLGIRPLGLTDYANSLASAIATNNVRLTAVETLTSARTVGSLTLATGGGITGSGVLTLASGTVLSAASATVSAPLAFGATEANLFTVGALTLSGALSGSGGVTKSGNGSLTLSGSNTFTGPLTINAGQVFFSTAANLGAGSAAITINANDAGLTYSGTTPFSLTRDLVLGAGIASLNTSNSSGMLTLAGTISGSGGLRLNPGSNKVSHTTILTGANTYTGPTQVAGGNLRIASDAALGAGGLLELATQGALILDGPWQTSRPISLALVSSFSPSAQIDTRTFDATLDGVITSTTATVNSITKNGSGTLRLRAASPFSGNVNVNAGTVTLAGNGSLRSLIYDLRGGITQSGALTLDNAATAISNRLQSLARVNLGTGTSFSILGNPAADVTEAISFIPSNGGTITLTAPGSGSTTLSLNALALTGPTALFIRGQNLGGAAGSAFTRLVTKSPFAPGILYGAYVSDFATSAPQFFAINDRTTDAAGLIGLRAPHGSEIATGTIQNAGNGGTTDPAAQFVATGNTSAVGAENTVAALILEPGSTLALAAGQNVTLSGGGILARRGGASAVTGAGTLTLGAASSAIYTDDFLTLGSTVAGNGSLARGGTGVLVIGGRLEQAGGLDLTNGTNRFAAGGAVRGNLNLSGAGIDLAGNAVTVGALNGSGFVQLGSGTLTIGGFDADSTHSGQIQGTGRLVLEAGAAGLVRRTFSGPNTFSGGVTLRGGRLAISGTSPLGTGTLTVENGTLLGSSSPVTTLTNATVLSGVLGVMNGSVVIASGVSVSGPGSIEVATAASLEIQTAALHTGETRSVAGAGGFPSTSPGSILLTGASGSLRSTSGIRMGAGSTLLVDNTTAFTGGSGGRLNDTAPIFLHSALLTLGSNATSSTVEAIGPLSGAGYSIVTAQTGANTRTRFDAPSLSRVARGTFLFQAPNLIDPFSPTPSPVRFVTAPAGLVGGGGTGLETSILPYAIADSTPSITQGGTGLLTVDPEGGLRELRSGDYATSLAAAQPTHNVRLAASVTNSDVTTINSLVLDYSPATTLAGGGTLHITSGLLLQLSGVNWTINNSLDFGPTEANIFTTSSSPTSSNRLVLNGPIVGSGGLTKSGTDTLVVAATANPFTGPLTINAGTVEFMTPASLGADTSPIVVHGAPDVLSQRTPGLRFGGTGAATLSRDLVAEGGPITLGSVGALQVTGAMSGVGGLLIEKLFASDGEVALIGAKSFAGNVTVRGRLAIDSDAALGTSTVLSLNGGTLRLAGPWTTSRVVTGSGTLDTNGFDADLEQTQLAVFNSGTFTKAGAGTLKVSDASSIFGTLNVTGGTFLLNSPFGAIMRLNVSSGGTFSGNGQVMDTLSPNNAAVINGILAPGDATTPGILTLGNLTFENGALLALDFAAPTRFDRVNVLGSLQLNGTTNLAVNLGYDPVDFGDSFTFLINDGSDATAGTSGKFTVGTNVLDEGERFTVSGQEFEITYRGGDGNDPTLRAVPEPSAAALILFTSGLLAGLRRPRGPKRAGAVHPRSIA